MSDITAGKEGPSAKKWVVTETREIIVESPFDLTASMALTTVFDTDTPPPTRAHITDDHTTRTAEPVES